jgi:Bacteriophage HK97-gp10, putative tail-component
MKLDEFADQLRDLPDRLSDADQESLGKAGDLVKAKAVIRIPKRTGRMASTIFSRRISVNTEQIGSNHPGAEVNERDPRWRNPPRHWLTTSLIDSMPAILDLFADGARQAIRSVIR